MSKSEVWDFWAKRYEHLWVQKYSLRPTRREILQYLRMHVKHIDPNTSLRILDIGCGTGQLLREIKAEFAGYPFELMGIDYSKQMITIAKESNGIDYQQLDVADIGNIQGKFDIIICTHSFPYYKDQTKIIQQIRDLLDDRGHVLMAQASQNNLYDRMAMFFVKFTTGKANYLSVKEVVKMTEESFLCKDVIRIKEKFFMPSIYLFVLAKKKDL